MPKIFNTNLQRNYQEKLRFKSLKSDTNCDDDDV